MAAAAAVSFFVFSKYPLIAGLTTLLGSALPTVAKNSNNPVQADTVPQNWDYPVELSKMPELQRTQETSMPVDSSNIRSSYAVEDDGYFRVGDNDNEAAKEAQSEILNILNMQGVYLPSVERAGWTPLTIAASVGHQELFNKLLELGEDPTVAGPDGWTPAFFAVEKGVGSGCDGQGIHKKFPHMTCPFNFPGGYAEILERLIGLGVDINAALPSGHTPIILAAKEGHIDIFKILLANGANPTAAGPDGWTPSMYAEDRGHSEILNILGKYTASQ